MSIPIDDLLIKKLSHLARLNFENNDKEAIKQDLKNILDFCDQLNKLDTEGVEPLIYMSDRQDGLRDDIVKDVLPREKALLNAPLKDSDYFKVPKVITK